MFDSMKKSFPGLYEFYLHLVRRKRIREIEKLKKIPEAQYRDMLGTIYEERFGRKLDWDNLQTYTEKMQWEKLYDKNPIKADLSDKYVVREWVENKIGNEYLIPLLGVWDRFDDIDFSTLPDKFVLKTNHGSATNIIVKDKNALDKKRARSMFTDWLDTDYAYICGFELHYSDIKPKIIAEAYLETDLGELQDYKFLCFDGKPYFCWVDIGRYSKHTRNVYDLEWNLQPWNQMTYGVYDKEIEKPKNFEKMVEIAQVLCEGFPHVRVDLYNVNGKIYFGEMTFTNGSGFEPIVPESYDKMLGDLWPLDCKDV